MSEVFLEVKNLCKSYPDFKLSDVSFSLSGGRIMGLIGKNGAGKSTTLKSMLNLVKPDSGSVFMLGKEFRENEVFCKQNIGVVLGEIDFYQHKKISDITAVTKRFYSNWDEETYKKYIEMFELRPEKRVKELSSGMRVKYMIALALSHGARLLILDEPTSGLDPVSRDDLLRLFSSLVQSGERSILFSTHIITDLEKCADDISYIKQGKLLSSAPKEEFINSFQYLKEEGETATLGLEEIMLRCERRDYDA
ncbi:ABC transporter ATP-binding protein [Clostridiaceae bacterium OttesenSCG-928-D20]|nr:ABC transporter ATP-binding protein [Clostridiaceae bacterium OttesenSCG-928-D20]